MVMRLQMITCGHIKDENGKSHRFSNKRIDDTIEFLSGVDGQVVIWSVFIRDVEDLVRYIKKEFGENSVRPFYGETNVLQRDEAITLFQDHKIKYLVSSTAGRFGTTLTAASTAFYYSNSYNLEFRLQSEDRIHRIGQHYPCLYVDALAPNTVNLPLIHNLRHKIDVSTVISGDSYRKWLVNKEDE
jgi:SNF2 family DNA or RNA helicase